MAGIVIREARPDEYGEVGNVLEDAFSHGSWVTDEYRKSLHRIAERAQHSRVWVAENANHELVAAVLTPRATEGGVLAFDVLGVAQKGRGQGLGHRLVEHAIAEAQSQEADRVMAG